MLEAFIHFQENLGKGAIRFGKKGFDRIIHGYSFVIITDKMQKIEDQIYKNLKDSQFITISQNDLFNQNTNDIFFIISFEKTIIILKHSEAHFLQSILKTNPNLSICFLKDSNNIISALDLSLKIENRQIKTDDMFNREIQSFVQDLPLNNKNNDIFHQIWQYIAPSIAGYLIKKGYYQTNFDRFDFFDIYKNNFSPNEKISESDYIELRILGIGSMFKVILIYLIEKQKLLAIKKPNIYDTEFPKLIKREKNNYMKMKYPLLPMFYGIVKETNDLIIEFINGQTLDKIKLIQFEEEDLITIIFELMLIVLYFHSNNYIIRDLKPNNLVITENKTLVMIDFDRVIERSQASNSNVTLDFQHEYIAPEINDTEKYTYQSDIYSLGKVISFIISNFKESKRISEIEEFCQNCTNKDENQRPSIYELSIEYYRKLNLEIKLYFSAVFLKAYSFENKEDSQYKFECSLDQLIDNLIRIDIDKAIHYYSSYKETNINSRFNENINKAIRYLLFASDQNYSIAQFYYGLINYIGKHVTQNIDKSMHYFKLAANRNNPSAQYLLGLIYYEGKYITQDINKSIYYFSLAADQNDPISQYNLGVIYSQGQYVPRNIKKAIHYLLLAAKQNMPIALYSIGLLYEEKEYMIFDIKKAIYYYSLASDQNYSYAQLRLGLIYYKGIYFPPNINEAIHYFTLAANQNISEAQYNLAMIYGIGEYVTRDMKKAISYFTLAANQNHLYAQYNLAVIYKYGQSVPQDINKAIYYFSLAANQNCLQALSNLGYMYYEGIYIKRDINKSIYYYTLAANQNYVKAQFLLGLIYYEGKYIERDINKAIHYFSLASNQNIPEAQYLLGIIYSKGEYINPDINKAIHYYTLAADNNFLQAQIKLSFIYYEGIYTTRDMTRAIYYFKLAADQYDPYAQFILGVIYSEGKYINRDMKKAIHYYSLAVNQNIPQAQFNLGLIYEEGKYLPCDINKAIYYYQLAANQNLSQAQFYLGLIYDEGIIIPRDMNKATHYYTLAANQNHTQAQLFLGLILYHSSNDLSNIKKAQKLIFLSAINGNKQACFVYGFLYHEGKIMKRDINQAIHFYKEASSIGISFAKNNLGIIHKNGFGEEIKPNAANAIVYFEEACKYNDYLSMYNLAHIYMYDDTIQKDINKSIELLIMSSEKFHHSLVLLCIALIIKHGSNLNAIELEFKINENKTNKMNELFLMVYQTICNMNLFYQSFFQYNYETYRKKDFLYNTQLEFVLSSDLNQNTRDENISKRIDISQLFYEGFGFEI